MEQPEPEKNLSIFLLLSFWGVFIWSGIRPNDRFTWVLEVLPAVVALAVLLATYRRFRFTRLAYLLMWGQALILLVGAHYTYAEMPLFNWLRDGLHLSRNHYDRVGHLAQGFVPAIVAREILRRTTPLRPGKMLFFLVVSICLAASAFYEFIEWWVALATGDAAEKFLGTQGDVWDTQWDMFMCFLGAILSQLLLAKIHDRELHHPGKLIFFAG
jgi:putative membrane protein